MVSGGGGAGPQGELQLLERVFLRLGHAETDDQLQEAVSKFLPPILLKLTSQNEGVRKKVMELLVHINKRIKNNNNIQLPLEALLLQYQDPAATSFVINFTIIYIKMGFPRLPVEKQVELIPSVLSSIEAKPTMHQDSLLLMIMPVLGELAKNPPGDADKRKSLLGLCEKPAVAKVLYSFMFDFMLLPYGSHPSLKAPDAKESQVPAGLSDYGWKRVSGDAPQPAEKVETTKTGIIKFIGAGLLPEMEVAIHILVGAADTRHGVTSASDTESRKLAGAIDWNDPELVRKLYSLFLGTLVLKDRPTVKPEHKRQPANTRIRLKLMPVLIKSREAAMQFPSCIQVTFDLLFGTTGNSNAKLKMMAVQFVHEIIHHCPENRLSPIGAVIMSALNRLVKEEKDNPKLRGSCYVAVGKLGLKIPSLVNKDMSLITTFFDGMSIEGPDTQLSLKEALGIMTPAFKALDSENKKFIEAMLATYIEKEGVQVKLVTIQYAGEVFPHDNVATRYTLLLGAGDKKEEVRNAARNSLYSGIKKLNAKDNGILKTKRLTNEPVLPDFLLILTYVMDKATIRLKSSYKQVVGNVTLPFPVSTGAEVCDYIRLCLWNSAGVQPNPDLLDSPQHEAPIVARYVKKLVGEGSGKKKDVVIKFLDLVDNLLSGQSSQQPALALLHLVGTLPHQLTVRYEKKLDWLRGLLSNTKEEFRETLANVLGLLAASLNKPDFERVVADLVKGVKEKTLEFQHGALLALGYAFGTRILLSRMNNPAQKYKDWKIFHSTCELVLSQLEASQSLMVNCGCLALAEIGRCSPLPFDDEGDVGKMDNKLGVMHKLLGIVKSTKVNMKVRERAATALGHICLGDAAYPHRRKLIDSFLESAQDIKDVELHFTIGEALVHCALGPASPDSRHAWAVSKDDFKPIETMEGDDLAWLIDQLTGRLTQSTHPNLKQAGCLWLLAVTRHCNGQPAVSGQLLRIQSAFMSLLGDGNDLIQDAASKGIAVVYESCSADQQESMVNSLLDTLLGSGKKEVNKVNDDTKVFQEGELGKNPMTGGNLSTYKELCSLATDMGQPDLVYKFMHLANYNATWNSRKGAAFGFSTIAARAGSQLEEHLPKMVPKLYRYQFDPTPRIQQSMSAIWAALVPESTKTVDRYLAEILAELQREITSPQWRVRESCCVALVELLRGRTLDTCVETLTLLWADIFRVMDDIKESVRLAAHKAAQALTRLSVKMCDGAISGPKLGERAVRAILPPLMEKGLSSTVAEVKAVTIATLMKITKSAGPLLSVHLPALIPALLEAASEIEGTEISHLSTRLAGRDTDVQERLDTARIAAIAGHPTMECVNFVLQYVDKSNLEQLVPRLVDLIKSCPALVTKGGAAAVVNNLTHQCPLDLQPYTGRLLAAFVAGLSSDRNAAVRMCYAKSIGQLMRTAKDSSKEKLFAKLKTWYMDKEDEVSRAAVAYTFQGINRCCPDVMKSFASVAMPIAFLAMHEEKTADGSGGGVQEVWEAVWQEGTPGSEGGIRLYLNEIMDLLPKALESGQWTVKAQAARAMGTVTTKLGGTINAAVQKRIASMLVAALAGRTWTGKECVLRSLHDLVVYGGDGVASNLQGKSEDVSIDLLLDTLMRECKKEKVDYRVVALTCTATILQKLNIDKFKEIYGIVVDHLPKPIVDGEPDENGTMDVKEKEQDKEEKEAELVLQEAILTSLGLAWPDSPETQKEFMSLILSHLEQIVCNTTRKNQEALAIALGHIIDKWKLPSDINTNTESLKMCETVFAKTAQLLSSLLLVPKYGDLRTKTLKVLGSVVKLLVESKRSSLVYLFRDEISKSLDGVIKDLASDPNIKTTARDLKTALNAIQTSQDAEQ